MAVYAIPPTSRPMNSPMVVALGFESKRGRLM